MNPFKMNESRQKFRKFLFVWTFAIPQKKKINGRNNSGGSSSIDKHCHETLPTRMQSR